jgi:hypothetical protein
MACFPANIQSSAQLQSIVANKSETTMYVPIAFTGNRHLLDAKTLQFCCINTSICIQSDGAEFGLVVDNNVIVQPRRSSNDFALQGEMARLFESQSSELLVSRPNASSTRILNCER